MHGVSLDVVLYLILNLTLEDAGFVRIFLVELQASLVILVRKVAVPVLRADAADVRGGGEDGGGQVERGLVARFDHQTMLLEDRILAMLTNKHFECFEEIRNRTKAFEV